MLQTKVPVHEPKTTSPTLVPFLSSNMDLLRTKTPVYFRSTSGVVLHGVLQEYALLRRGNELVYGIYCEEKRHVFYRLSHEVSLVSLQEFNHEEEYRDYYSQVTNRLKTRIFIST